MKFLLGRDWRDIFDVIIVQARKPKFFTERSRPFRHYDLAQKIHLWDKVHHLEKGHVYYEVRLIFSFYLLWKLSTSYRFICRGQ